MCLSLRSCHFVILHALLGALMVDAARVFELRAVGSFHGDVFLFLHDAYLGSWVTR